MYQPILKNKLNELKGLNDVLLEKDFNPIIELTELNKKYKIEDVVQYLIDKIPNTIKGKSIYIDVPTYIYNDVYEYFELKNIENKHKLFLTIKNLTKDNMSFIPVISFDYSYENEKISYKENIKFLKKMLKDFDNLAIRIFSNETFKNNDEILLSQIYDFLGEELSDKNITLIVEINKNNKIRIINLLEEITSEYKINQITLVGESFNNDSRLPTVDVYDRIKNIHLLNFLDFKKSFDINLVYADYTLVDKIPSKIEIDPSKGFLYYPFIKFTTDDGNMCYFSADAKGNYHQYKNLAQSVVSKITKYSQQHCSTCKFIKDVANGDCEKFKAGSTWKYRMIAHHITTMANYFK